MYSEMSVLRVGAVGSNVEILQNKLEILGYYAPNPTGSFGLATEDAVINFQSDNNLFPSGVVDDSTWNLLYDLTPSMFPMARIIRPNLSLGSTGEYVSELQSILKKLLYYNYNINGNFDSNTESAVKAFQRINNLTVDGKVGRDTWSALIFMYSPLAICGDIEEENNGEDLIHTVVKGDTLWDLARRYNTSVAKLKELNNLTSDSLSIGQKLIVGKKEEEVVPPESNYVVHVVEKGDTLYSLANKYKTTVDEIKKLNNLNSNILSIGQELKVKQEDSIEENYLIHTVVKGDTLWDLARRYNTTIDSIKKLNNLKSDTLSVGVGLKVPKVGDKTEIEYIVKSGDTLWDLARKFNTTVDGIKKLNNLSSDKLSIGQKLKINI